MKNQAPETQVSVRDPIPEQHGGLYAGEGRGISTNILTDREREVLQLVAEGRSNKEVAGELGVSIKTVQTHRAHLMRKLDAHDRIDLVRYAATKGVISPN